MRVGSWIKGHEGGSVLIEMTSGGEGPRSGNIGTEWLCVSCSYDVQNVGVLVRMGLG